MKQNEKVGDNYHKTGVKGMKKVGGNAILIGMAVPIL